jgi:hypothetical protein
MRRDPLKGLKVSTMGKLLCALFSFISFSRGIFEKIWATEIWLDWRSTAASAAGVLACLARGHGASLRILDPSPVLYSTVVPFTLWLLREKNLNSQLSAHFNRVLRQHIEGRH